MLNRWVLKFDFPWIFNIFIVNFLKPVYSTIHAAMIVPLTIYFSISVYIASLINHVDSPEGSFDEQCHLPIAALYCNGSYGEVISFTNEHFIRPFHVLIFLLFYRIRSGITKSLHLLVYTFLLWHRSNCSICRAPYLI